MSSKVFACKKCNSNNIVIKTSGENKNFKFIVECNDCGLKLNLSKDLDESIYIWSHYNED